MSMKEGIKISGKVIIFKSTDGITWNKTLEKANLVVTTGLEFIADAMANNNVNEMDFIAVGDDATPASASDTALLNEFARKIQDDKDGDGDIFRIETEFDFTEAIGTWNELAVFDSAVGGIMLNRLNVSTSKTAAEKVRVRFEFTFST